MNAMDALFCNDWYLASVLVPQCIALAGAPQAERPSEYLLLPAEFTSPQRLSLLKRLRLATEDSTDLPFLEECSRQLSVLAPSVSQLASFLRREQLRTMSTALLKMCQHIATSKQGQQQTAQQIQKWASVRAILVRLPIALTAELPFPYNASAWPLLMSMEDTADYRHHRIVSSATAVTDRQLGDTEQLRSSLGLPTDPLLHDIVQHLLCTISAEHPTPILRQQHHPLKEVVKADIMQAYQRIFGAVDTCIARGQVQSGIFCEVTQTLKETPWVLVGDSTFLSANRLVFDLCTDSTTGERIASCTITLPCNVRRLLFEMPICSGMT